jgi:hypothetical protein
MRFWRVKRLSRIARAKARFEPQTIESSRRGFEPIDPGAQLA